MARPIRQDPFHNGGSYVPPCSSEVANSHLSDGARADAPEGLRLQKSRPLVGTMRTLGHVIVTLRVKALRPLVGTMRTAGASVRAWPPRCCDPS